MIQANLVRYDPVLVTPQGALLHLIDAVEALEWEDLPGEVSVRMSMDVRNVEVQGTPLHQLIPTFGKVLLYADWGSGGQEVLRATVFARQSDHDRSSLSITAYDDLIYLTKSKDERYYSEGTTGRTIIQDIAGAWRLPLGTVEGPDVALARQIFRRRSVAEMIRDVLEQSRRRGAPRFVLRSRANQIEVVKVGTNSPVYHFGADHNVSGVTEREDVDDLITRVKIVGQESGDDYRPVVAVLDGQTEFGVLQEVLYEEQYDTPAAAREAGSTLLRDLGKPARFRRFRAPDLPFLRKGDKVHVTAGYMDGYYLVAGISHDAKSRTMTVEVEDVE